MKLNSRITISTSKGTFKPHMFMLVALEPSCAYSPHRPIGFYTAISMAKEAASRANGEASRANEVASRANKVVSKANEVASRANEVK